MVNRQQSDLDGLMNFLIAKEAADSAEHLAAIQAMGQKFKDAKVQSAIPQSGQKQDTMGLPPTEQRIYFTSSEPPKDFSGTIYVGEKNAAFWVASPGQKGVPPSKSKKDSGEKSKYADYAIDFESLPDNYLFDSDTALDNDFQKTFTELPLSKVSEFINSKEFKTNPKYLGLKHMFEYSVLSQHDGAFEGKSSLSATYETYENIILGETPKPLKQYSWEKIKNGLQGWGGSGSGNSSNNYMRYWWGELTDAPLTYYAGKHNPDYTGIYADDAERDGIIKMLEDAIEGGLTEIKNLPDIGKYPSPKTKKAANDILKRIKAGKEFDDGFHNKFNGTINADLIKMRDKAYAPLKGMSDDDIANLSKDEKKKHMRALYRETFEDMQKLSTAIYSHTHPGETKISVWRGVSGKNGMIEAFGGTPGLPPSLTGLTTEKLSKLTGKDLQSFENAGHEVMTNVASAAGFTHDASQAKGWADTALINLEVEPKDIIAPYPLIAGNAGHAGEHEIGILRKDAGGRMGRVWLKEAGAYGGIKIKGQMGTYKPIEVKLPDEDWGNPNSPNLLTNLHQSLGGSNSGSVMESKNGNSYYVKYGNESQSVVEHLTNQLYQKAGVPVHDAQLISYKGSNAFITPYAENAKDMSAEDMAGDSDVQEGFVIDAWLGNWDVVGSGNTNIKSIDGKAIRVDVGGSLYMRANQGMKNDQDFFGATSLVEELESMRGKGPKGGMAKWTKPVFGNLSDEQFNAGVQKLKNVSNEDIANLVKDSKIPDEYKNKLAHTLTERRNSILKAYDVKKQETVELPYPNLVDESKLVTLQITSDEDKSDSEQRKKAKEDDQK